MVHRIGGEQLKEEGGSWHRVESVGQQEEAQQEKDIMKTPITWYADFKKSI